MTLETLRAFLGWCGIINLGGLFLWWFFISAARGLTFGVHSRLFDIPVEDLARMHYKGLMKFKLAIFFFNIVRAASLTSALDPR